MVTLYNTLTRNKEEFTPLDTSKVSIYSCGPTVYNYLHVGNWVAYIRWDILVRTLLASGYEVTRIMNITDVGHLVSDADDGEDKMEKGAKREGKSVWDIAQMYTDDFLNGMQLLQLLAPSNLTKATDFIPEQLEIVRILKNKGFTYQIDDGIYFDTAKFPTYADFAHLNLDELKEGARVDFNPQKRNASDFALWKFSPKDEKREMEWDIPADILEDNIQRKGFPGWHLECSAMAMNQLGETIDIHTGGIDHIPVHHTNEIAQSEAATGKQFSRFWLHNNFLLVDGTKVSKSLGNTYELKDLIDKGYTPQDFRMFVLQSHYRTESNFTWDNLQAAKNRLNNWKEVAVLEYQPVESSTITQNDIKHTADSLLKYLQDDLNTTMALVSVDELFDAIREEGLSNDVVHHFSTLLTTISDLLGLTVTEDNITEEQKTLLANRQQARIEKNWIESDRIRDELAAQGIGINDMKNTQRWYRISI
jgi:cysteinyl-tRNA synthetase